EIQQTSSLITEQERKYQARELYERCIVPRSDTNDIIGCLTDVIRFDPRFAEAWALRGFYYSYLLKQEEQAISDYTEAIRLDPQAFVYVARGEALLRIAKQKRAMADAREALRRDSDEWEAWTLLASAHFRERKYANTVNDATNAIERNLPEYRSHKQPARHEGIQLAYLFSLRGFAYKKLRQPERAFADFNESLRITDELVKAHPTLEDDKTFRGSKRSFFSGGALYLIIWAYQTRPVMSSNRPVRWGKGMGAGCSKWLRGLTEMKTSGYSQLATFIAEKRASRQNQTSPSVSNPPDTKT